MSTISGKINLAKLPHVVMEKKGKSGMIKGIFIPIEAAKLFLSEKGNVYLDIIGFELKDKKGDDTHIVKQSLSKETRDKMTEEEERAMPIIGNFRLKDGFEEREPEQNASPGKVVKEEDDLPF